MSGPWWVREGFISPSLGLETGAFGKRPRLVSDRAADVSIAVLDRRATHTPDWTDDSRADAGQALVSLFGELAAPAARRLNRLGDKALVDFMSAAGVGPTPARASSAMVEFTVSNAAKTSVVIPEGFQVGASPADGSNGTVTFETTKSIYATASALESVLSYRAGVFYDVTKSNGDLDAWFDPFGDDPQVRDALVLGFNKDVAPTTQLTLGVFVHDSDEAPDPISDGGVVPAVPAAPLVLEWSARVQNGRFETLEVMADDTSHLSQSGIITVTVPRSWTAEKWEEIGDDVERYWIRLRIIYGSFEGSPRLASVRINIAPVKAIRTVRNEVLEDLDPRDPREGTLRNTPVVPGSVKIEVDSEPLASSGDDATEAAVTVWTATDDLREHGPNDRVFELDPESGRITFGDGEHGMAIPPGFRNVRATSYQVASGAASAVSAEDISQLLSSVRYVTGVTNPLAASGGVDRSSDAEAIQDGPDQIRAGGRGVTTADVEYLATTSDGADIRRAHAVAGLHPVYIGLPVPGVIGVFVVPALKASEDGPPIPDELTLANVAEHIADEVGPAGAEVVVAPTTFRLIRTEIEFIARAGEDTGRIIREIEDQVDAYFDPYGGGDSGRGWAFGGTVSHARVLRLILNVDGVIAIPELRFVIDGVRHGLCENAVIGANELLWPDGHEIFPVESEDDA